MKISPIIVITLLIIGCQSHNADNAASGQGGMPAKLTTLSIDISTPDRALKSYWQAKDISRKISIDWAGQTLLADLQKKIEETGYKATKLMAGDVLASHQANENKIPKMTEYNRELVEIKQDTESRATAIVKITNSTPLPQGAVISESAKKGREEGEKFKYILEKDGDGWKVSQVYKYESYLIYSNKDPWNKIYSPPAQDDNVEVYVNEYEN